MPSPVAMVTAVGANTSLGGAASACAAARAGLARPSPLGLTVFDVEQGAVPVHGHPVRTVTGFQGKARLLALAMPALRELAQQGSIEALGEVAFLVALPDLEARARLADSAVSAMPGPEEQLSAMVGLKAPPSLRRAYAGSVGFVEALQTAVELLAEGRTRACVVGGVDTLCDTQAIEALVAQDRLKTGDNPVGLAPGEASAFFMLEAPESARRRAMAPLGSIAGIGLAREPRSGEEPPVGEGFAKAFTHLVATSGNLPSGAWMILDRNGEATRANDWGACVQRLTARMPGLFPAPQWDPAASFGDTGAASGALGLLIALRAFARNTAPRRCAAVVSSSEDGGRAVVRVEPAR